MQSNMNRHGDGDPTGKAIGFLELRGAAFGVTALDEAVKAAPIDILQAKVVCPAKFIVILAGEVAAIQVAVAAAKTSVGSGLYDDLVLGRIHPDLYRGLYDQFHTIRQDSGILGGKGATLAKEGEAFGVVETLSMACGLASADKALKTASVKLRELRLGYALGGRSYFVVAGATSQVQEALTGAVEVATHWGSLGGHSLILRPTAP
jgi:microcompartment protein CcmL/EutN